MEKHVGIAILVFFGAMAVVLVGGGVWVIFGGNEPVRPTAVPAAPEIPNPPQLGTDPAAAGQQVSEYQYQTSAYAARVTAYDKYLTVWSSQTSRSAERVAQYEAVVKALSPFLTPLVSAFVAYAFAKATANIVRNVVGGRHPDANLQDLAL